jgi:hypothetical protein
VEFQGHFQGRSVTSVEGSTMPVFTFEKISPPMRRVTDTDAAAQKPRGVLTQLVSRFVEARARRANPADDTARPQSQKSAK